MQFFTSKGILIRNSTEIQEEKDRRFSHKRKRDSTNQDLIPQNPLPSPYTTPSPVQRAVVPHNPAVQDHPPAHNNDISAMVCSDPERGKSPSIHLPLISYGSG